MNVLRRSRPFLIKRNFFWSSKPAQTMVFSEQTLKVDPVNTPLNPPTNSPLETLKEAAVGQETKLQDSVTIPANGDVLIDDTLANALIDNAPVLESITQLGDLKLLGLASSYTPVGWIQSLLELNHVTFGMPWWGTIALTTVLVRFLVLPITVKSQRSMGKMAMIRPQLEPIQQEMMNNKKIGDQAGVTRQAQKLQVLFKENGINPFSGLFLGLVQMPIFLSFFLAVRKMADYPIPGFENGGLWWFVDLTVGDPYYCLPVISALGMLTGFEINSELTKNQSDFARNAIRGVSLMAIPLMGSLPAAVFVYVTTSSLFTLMQIIVLKQPAVRKRLDLPDLKLLVAPKAAGMTSVKPLSLTQALKALQVNK